MLAGTHNMAGKASNGSLCEIGKGRVLEWYAGENTAHIQAVSRPCPVPAATDVQLFSNHYAGRLPIAVLWCVCVCVCA